MASFNVSVTADSQTSVWIQGSFTGGDADYSNYRLLEVSFYGTGAPETRVILSEEDRGADSTFRGSHSGFQAGETYRWVAYLEYWDGTAWVVSSYMESGSVTLPDEPQPTGHVQTWVYQNGWKRAEPWIYQNGWKRAEPWIYNGGWR